MDALGLGIIALIALVVLVFFTIVFMASRYKRCPSDKVLVIYGQRRERTLEPGYTCTAAVRSSGR